ncbi:nuclear factor nf7 [Cystoisospora suis]|uniref:Nuclear factor nf7 n=1 Tax=Cystoisospora suis TaxID=483139 RepID=A0A2C6KR23_9APIC|nr:nuclear factor nf7 [Cystoisospora suis]
MTLAVLLPKEEGVGFSLRKHSSSSSTGSGGSSPGDFKVAVDLSNEVSDGEWERVFRSRLFQDWLSSYARSDRMTLTRVSIHQIQYSAVHDKAKAKKNAPTTLDGDQEDTHAENDDANERNLPKIVSVDLTLEAKDKENKVYTGTIILRPLRRAVLVLLRNIETGTDTCCFVRKPNLTLGLTDNLELPEGDFDTSTGRFVGACAEALEKELGHPVYEKDLVNLTQVAFGNGGLFIGRGCSTQEEEEFGLKMKKKQQQQGEEEEAGCTTHKGKTSKKSNPPHGGSELNSSPHETKKMIDTEEDGQAAICHVESTRYDERVELYLYRANLSVEKMSSIEARIGRIRRRVGGGKPGAAVVVSSSSSTTNASSDTSSSSATKSEEQQAPGAKTMNDASCGEGEPIKLSLVQLGDAWSLTTNVPAVTAILLVHELRYHRLMPKYRHSLFDASSNKENGNGNSPGHTTHNSSGAGGPEGRSSGDSSQGGEGLVKSVAQFKHINELEPTSKGLNLRVKVVSPIVIDKERTFPSGRVSREGHVVVGDSQALITLKLVDSQLDLPDAEGSCLLIRNGLITMEEGHMKLLVDRWGKIT